MHLADGVLSTPVIVASYGVSIASMAVAAKGIKDEEIPKISLMAGTFFAVSLISIPVPPTSVHPLLCGLIGIILGKKAPLAFFPALLLQALLFRHGGITSLGANTVMLSLPAYLSYVLYKKMPIKKPAARGGIIGAISVVMTVIILIFLLALTDARFAAGDFSVVKIAMVGHAPLMIVEGIVTAFAVQFIDKNKKDWIEERVLV
ncbi:cobalamin (vitamin B12) biosynthesis CbiM protein CbiM [Clostridium aceticum]|uniref:Cobalamin (Vitamin B12) biosynthesis CbiM protein CbiM n=1 Tax=Clostridium aceticum TaxID=84022 RepID=A0A0D8IAH8_9CLOT|nr:CbiM family transporter [Clostridium aceticum]AKL96041.1 cobalamin (vitamin B12) biosynthesis CbiM protein CbiM [Clostridium aceticum]KJF27027.1 cobalamin biosynthesis protein CbiM [Clostridium aceticum]